MRTQNQFSGKQYNGKMNAVMMALIAALLYSISSPASKLLLEKLPPVLLAALLYLGAGTGMFIVDRLKRMRNEQQKEAKITTKELPAVIWMIVLDMAAPILLMFGLTYTSAANASLLNNFEIVSTSVIALCIFNEAIGKRMWFAIVLITLSSIILTVKDFSVFSFTIGSVFVLLGCICWGFENNCTRMLSIKNPFQIVMIKGLGSGIGSLLISIIYKQYSRNLIYIGMAMLLGFVAYGLSISFYIYAQRELGAVRTSAFYAVAPFLGVAISWIVFREEITIYFVAALLIMLVGTYFAVSEYHNHKHLHLLVTHDHKHNHSDSHHNHVHIPEVIGEHCHEHTHEKMEHIHNHTPDVHHSHTHKGIS
jgi:drug/metabolite transporter (DMT)-like permease